MSTTDLCWVYLIKCAWIICTTTRNVIKPAGSITKRMAKTMIRIRFLQNSRQQFMMTSWYGNVFASLALWVGTSLVSGEFPLKGQWRGALIFSLICALNRLKLSKQSWGWWFEMPSPSWWRHCNVMTTGATLHILRLAGRWRCPKTAVYLLKNKWGH